MKLSQSAGMAVVRLLSMTTPDLAGFAGVAGAIQRPRQFFAGPWRKPWERKGSVHLGTRFNAEIAPDFLAVVDFDEDSPKYGKVISTVPPPPPGNIGNEPHHCHLNSNKTILGCGGLLSLLKIRTASFSSMFPTPKGRASCSPPRPLNPA